MRKAVIDKLLTASPSAQLICEMVDAAPSSLPLARLLFFDNDANYWVLICWGKIEAFGHFEDVPIEQIEYITSPSSDVLWNKDEFEKRVFYIGAAEIDKNGMCTYRTEGTLRGKPISFSFTYHVVEK